MRTMSKEYHDKLRRGNSVYATILNTPRPDFTELDKECEDLKAWITEEHKKDRQVL